MSFFSTVSPYEGAFRLTPRKAFLLIWLLLCVAALQILSRQDAQWWTREQTSHHTQADNPEATLPKVAVLVAGQAIKKGQKLTPELFTTQSRVITGLEDRIADPEISFNRMYATVNLNPGNILLSENITHEVPANALTNRIPQGYRAVSVSVNPETAVEGWVQPGSRVDVVFTTTLRGERSITTLVENVEVLSAERSLTPATSQDATSTSPIPAPSLITLLVTAENAARIELAKHTGIISLVLRGADQSVGSSGDTITASQLLSAPRKAQTTGTVAVEGAVFGVTARGKMIPVDEMPRDGQDNAKKGDGTNDAEADVIE